MNVSLRSTRIAALFGMLLSAAGAHAGVLMPLDTADVSTIASSADTNLAPVLAGGVLILMITVAACARGGQRRPR